MKNKISLNKYSLACQLGQGLFKAYRKNRKKDQEGNDFACKDFLIFATFPKLESGLSTQLYIGPPAWKWIVFMPTAMSVSAKRTWRLHLHHLVGGKWGLEGYYTDGELPHQSTAGVAVTVTSVEAPGEKLNQLLFWSNTTSHFPNGTTFEIYGR